MSVPSLGSVIKGKEDATRSANTLQYMSLQDHHGFARQGLDGLLTGINSDGRERLSIGLLSSSAPTSRCEPVWTGPPFDCPLNPPSHPHSSAPGSTDVGCDLVATGPTAAPSSTEGQTRRLDATGGYASRARTRSSRSKGRGGRTGSRRRRRSGRARSSQQLGMTRMVESPTKVKLST